MFLASENKLTKKKRKIARQYISFDENDSPLSTSVPSSSSSSASDISFDNNSVKNKIQNSLILIEEEKHSKSPQKIMDTKEHEENVIPQRKMSIESSGSRDKFTTKVPEILTPANNIEIGELTPVSMEINANFGSPDTSDDLLEIPTDISAVLTALEDKNKEELRKKDEKINMVLKENEFLQNQIKKYVSAIQMLRKNDSNELNRVLEGLELEDRPDYEKEAKLFENKLIQVKIKIMIKIQI